MSPYRDRQMRYVRHRILMRYRVKYVFYSRAFVCLYANIEYVAHSVYIRQVSNWTSRHKARFAIDDVIMPRLALKAN